MSSSASSSAAAAAEPTTTAAAATDAATAADASTAAEAPTPPSVYIEDNRSAGQRELERILVTLRAEEIRGRREIRDVRYDASSPTRTLYLSLTLHFNHDSPPRASHLQSKDAKIRE